VRVFDQKFGADFLAGVPSEPGVYRLYDGAGALLYVGKARDLRRRLAQYRTTRRKKKDRKRRRLVRAAARIVWETCASELEAALAEVRLIQALRPRENVAGAFPFLYPFVGIREGVRETHFCLTTSPDAFPAFDLHGAFRSREVTGEAFFSLMRLLGIVGHAVPRRRGAVAPAPHSYVFGFRRLPPEWPDMWRRLLRGHSREGLEHLSLSLLERASARARSAEIQADLRAVERFFDDEAAPLAAAVAAGEARYPVPQRERDLLLLKYRRQHLPR
jgi:excinuclease ABC subunit C